MDGWKDMNNGMVVREKKVPQRRTKRWNELETSAPRVYSKGDEGKKGKEKKKTNDAGPEARDLYIRELRHEEEGGEEGSE